MNNKKWTICCLILTLLLLAVGALPTILIDPYFHYHGPLEGITYEMDDQRYQNDGILKNFTYDAVITGTSMTENFKTAEMDALFGVSSVKTAFPGGSYKEIADRLSNAFRANPGIRYVLRGIDCNRIAEHKDTMSYDDAMYPEYLYDWTVFNDAAYVLNKQVLFDDTVRLLALTRAGVPSTTFDEYNYWSDNYTYGADAIKASYNRPEQNPTVRETSEADLEQLRQSIDQNYLTMAEENPDTQFYLFFTPYSIFWWDSMQRYGEMDLYIDLMKEASRMLLEYNNIHLFSFFDLEELICNTDVYKDTLHYSGAISSQLMQWMQEGRYQLTRDNYAAHWEAVREFYGSYDYESLFE